MNKKPNIILAIELSRNSDLRVYEIAERVGFSNAYYLALVLKTHRSIF